MQLSAMNKQGFFISGDNLYKFIYFLPDLFVTKDTHLRSGLI